MLHGSATSHKCRYPSYFFPQLVREHDLRLLRMLRPTGGRRLSAMSCVSRTAGSAGPFRDTSSRTVHVAVQVSKRRSVGSGSSDELSVLAANQRFTLVSALKSVNRRY